MNRIINALRKALADRYKAKKQNHPNYPDDPEQIFIEDVNLNLREAVGEMVFSDGMPNVSPPPNATEEQTGCFLVTLSAAVVIMILVVILNSRQLISG